MKEAVRVALQTEDEGYKMYTQALRRSTHPLGREILTFLANEELKHTSIIKRMVQKLQSGERFSAADIDLNAKKGATIFTEALKNPGARIKGIEDDLEVLREAVKFETEGSAFFAKAAQEADNEDEKKFFEIMAREERAHKKLLESSIEYLENPEAWFDKDAQIHLDGA